MAPWSPAGHRHLMDMISSSCCVVLLPPARWHRCLWYVSHPGILCLTWTGTLHYCSHDNLPVRKSSASLDHSDWLCAVWAWTSLRRQAAAARVQRCPVQKKCTNCFWHLVAHYGHKFLTLQNNGSVFKVWPEKGRPCLIPIWTCRHLLSPSPHCHHTVCTVIWQSHKHVTNTKSRNQWPTLSKSKSGTQPWSSIVLMWQTVFRLKIIFK